MKRDFVSSLPPRGLCSWWLGTHEPEGRRCDRSMCVQIITVEPAGHVVVMPAGEGRFVLPPGSVTVIDCQDQWIDMRGRPRDQPSNNADVVMYRCHILSPDALSAWTRVGFFYSTTASGPCNVRLPLLDEADHAFVRVRNGHLCCCLSTG